MFRPLGGAEVEPQVLGCLETVKRMRREFCAAVDSREELAEVFHESAALFDDFVHLFWVQKIDLSKMPDAIEETVKRRLVAAAS